MGSDVSPFVRELIAVFQSTLPHGERLGAHVNDVNVRTISIHAPAWGATKTVSSRRHDATYFNPRSRMGSDRTYLHRNQRKRRFQSTLPHGERLAAQADFIRKCRISIHAPAWGATKSSKVPLADTSDFNPRSRMGSDCTVTCRCRCNADFNPRSRMGSDCRKSEKTKGADRFQSTLPHGERPRATCLSPPSRIFQSTLPHGERHTRPMRPFRMPVYFNPRSRMGSDLSLHTLM